MIGILLAKFKLFLRSPGTFVIFTAMSIGFAFLLSGAGGMTSFQVPAYATEEKIRDSYIGEQLEEVNALSLQWMSEAEMVEQIANGKAEVGVVLGEDSFKVIVGVDSPNVTMIEQSIRDIYKKKHQLEQLVGQLQDTEMDIQQVMRSPIFSIQTGSFRSSDAVVYDSSYQALFGFTLFFVIYTIAYNVLPILIEKKEGVWDRVILSPVRKWEMYVANLIYSFITGYLQILIIFFVFRYLVGVDFNGNFFITLGLLIPYVFAIVSLSVVITAIVKNVQQFNAVIPIVAVSMAMIGGAYWPLEIVESKVILTLSKVNPLTYGMEVLNGFAIYGYSVEELLFPISILVMMGVLLMGLGIHLMERRHV
ncbi:ABC transporter permease [Ornithinibacillus sp. L9]|uniref:ABC transporter permease n=1 Tax=Ornithinibacillus caprae TaxID=2678566 RepID=A0A6N8FJF4_9BACI|nr:ABC transporter permease [Ornithinibacillus caprae]MUK88816.1 ABC transporter permease [Ornithinibacillus caprae]